MELTEAVRRRHMTRNFTDRPIPAETVGHLLELALRAPSAGNTQGREFVVLEGAEQCDRYWEATTDDAWRTRSRRVAGMRRAPVVILPYADPGAYEERYREADKDDGRGVSDWPVPFWFVDTAFSVMTLLLGATEAGLGAAFLGNFRGEDGLRRVLGVPDGFRWFGAVLLGFPGEPDPPSTSVGRGRRTIEECVHRGGW